MPLLDPEEPPLPPDDPLDPLDPLEPLMPPLGFGEPDDPLDPRFDEPPDVPELPDEPLPLRSLDSSLSRSGSVMSPSDCRPLLAELPMPWPP